MRTKAKLLTKKMIFLLFLAELFALAFTIVFIYWMSVVKSSTFGWQDIIHSLHRHNHGEVSNKIDIHITIFFVVFGLFLPNIKICNIIFDSAPPTFLVIGDCILKVISFIFFFGGWVDILSSDLSKIRSDFGIHGLMSLFCFIAFVLYVMVTGVKVAGHFCQYIFRIRFLGKVLKFVANDVFEDFIDHWLHDIGWMTLLTGIFSYITIQNRFHENKEQSPFVVILSALLIILFCLIQLTTNYKHEIVDHKHFLTDDEFRQNFAQFSDLLDKNESVADKVTEPEMM